MARKITQTDIVEDQDSEDYSEEEIISKSQLKREANAAQQLGQDLLTLNPADLEGMDLPESLVSALNEARRIKKHGALKRQFQYIGKLMRKIDIEPIREEYLRLTNHYRHDVKEFHQLENWRDRLLSEGDKALEELINAAPGADRQHLRQLMRQAAKETKLNKPPKSAREIFKYLKTLFE